MKAVVLEGNEKPLVFKDVENYKAEADEVIVKIKAAAFNHRDVWIQKGQYAGLKYPSILGSDGSGIVSEVGDNIDKSLIGKEVIINPSHDWGDNPKAQKNSFKILGLPDDGTFAEYVKVKSQYIYKKPENLSFIEASALPLAGLTAYRALFGRARLEKGEKVLITGIGGGVALFALQFALACDAEVYVTSGSDEKIQRAISIGAKDGVNYKNEKWHKELIEKAGLFDVIVDSAVGDGFNKLVDVAAPGGRIVFYGGTKGAINNLSPQKIFWKQLSILGSTMGSTEEFESMINFVEKNNIKPVIDKVFKMEDAEEAIKRMANSEQFGKIILENQQ